MLDPNRNGDVINIPNSIDEMFYIETVINTNIEATSNDSPILLNPPIAFACIHSPFYYSPSAYDPNGDSLVYSLVDCRGNNGDPISGYVLPVASNIFKIDPNTGIITWDTPIRVGEYNIAILIEEWRRVINGSSSKLYNVGSILRDMQITVRAQCSNYPPEILNVKDYCVEARTNLNFTVYATDAGDQGSTSGNSVLFEAFGGPMVIEPAAKFITNGSDTVTGIFDWDTECNHVQNRPHTVTFKATDNGIPNLSNYQTSDILVVAPSVKNVSVEAITSHIDIHWEKEVCVEAVGYRIYRRLGPTGFIPDSCETGVPNHLGYSLIYEGEDINEVSFQDDNEGKGLIPGEVYCYLIIAYFGDGAESYASQEVCDQLIKDVPIITNVSVSKTSINEGRMRVAWSAPTDHDTLQYPGPYKYKILRTLNRKPEDFAVVGSVEGNLSNIYPDTVFTDIGLDTEEIEYAYRIEMMDMSSGADVSMGFSVFATSIYLESIPKDNKLILIWDELVPWRNYEYAIFKRNNEGNYDSIGVSYDRQFIDSNLHNGREYCYYIKSKGEYSLESIAKPLYDSSQMHCGTPIDLEPPCPPILTAYVEDCSVVKDLLRNDPTLCGYSGDGIRRIDQVDLEWTNPNETCDSTDDVVGYDLYYSSTKKGNFYLLESFNSPDKLDYTHLLNNTRAGCYYITARDSFNNVSPVVDTVCTDNCLLYELPNVFTPNGDGVNDLFRPFPYCFVDRVEMQIVNRWGGLVFETNDPDVNWDGTNYLEKTKVTDGVYYYTCIVDQISVDGIIKVKLKGVVHILGSKDKDVQN